MAFSSYSQGFTTWLGVTLLVFSSTKIFMTLCESSSYCLTNMHSYSRLDPIRSHHAHPLRRKIVAAAIVIAFLAMVSLGLLIGLAFLPALLSLCGPIVCVSHTHSEVAKKSSQHPQDPDDPTPKQSVDTADPSFGSRSSNTEDDNKAYRLTDSALEPENKLAPLVENRLEEEQEQEPQKQQQQEKDEEELPSLMLQDEEYEEEEETQDDDQEMEEPQKQQQREEQNEEEEEDRSQLREEEESPQDDDRELEQKNREPQQPEQRDQIRQQQQQPREEDHEHEQEEEKEEEQAQPKHRQEELQDDGQELEQEDQEPQQDQQDQMPQQEQEQGEENPELDQELDMEKKEEQQQQQQQLELEEEEQNKDPIQVEEVVTQQVDQAQPVQDNGIADCTKLMSSSPGSRDSSADSVSEDDSKVYQSTPASDDVLAPLIETQIDHRKEEKQQFVQENGPAEDTESMSSPGWGDIAGEAVAPAVYPEENVAKM